MPGQLDAFLPVQATGGNLIQLDCHQDPDTADSEIHEYHLPQWPKLERVSQQRFNLLPGIGSFDILRALPDEFIPTEDDEHEGCQHGRSCTYIDDHVGHRLQEERRFPRHRY